MTKIEEKKPEEKKVSVEMTEKQKEKVTAILAADEAPKEPTKWVEVELRFEHRRLGKAWGPGTVRVEEALGSSLYAADYNAYISRIKEMESANRNVEILSRGVTVIRPSK